MISFELGEELELIRQSASRFAQEQLRGAARAAERARAVPPELCQAFAELGLGSAVLAEDLDEKPLSVSPYLVEEHEEDTVQV